MCFSQTISKAPIPNVNQQPESTVSNRAGGQRKWLRWATRYTLPDIEEHGGISFSVMSRVAEAFGDEFPHFNDKARISRVAHGVEFGNFFPANSQCYWITQL